MSKGNFKRTAKNAKKHPVLALFVVLLLVLIIFGTAALWYFRPDVFHIYLGLGEHSWGEWQTETEPTCVKTGFKFRACETCGKREEEIIPATGSHSWGEWQMETEPTCVKTGFKFRACETCSKREEEIIPATGSHIYGEDGICSACGFDKNLFVAQEDIAQAEFSIHIIDLGKYAGDSIYIKAAGKDILIDAGSRAESAELICSYLDNYVSDGRLEYVIATHADQDHIAAFAGKSKGESRTGVLYRYGVDTLIRFDNVKKDKLANESKPNTVYGGFKEAENYLKENGTKVFTAGQCYNETDGAKRQFWLDGGRTLSMNILYNYYYYNTDNDENNHSVVTLFTKDVGNDRHNFLFTGDLEKEGEERLVEYYSHPSNSKSEYDVLPEVDFYKAGHHGSGTSSSEKLLSAIKPKFVAVSCCAGSPEYTLNNFNTFPYRQSLERILKYTDKIYCTGQATELPELDADGKFAEKKWEYEPLNGNIVFLLELRAAGQGTVGNVKLWCGNSFESLTETEWFKNYRNL